MLQLERSLLMLNPWVCPASIKAFLLGANAVLKLRHAIKDRRWDLQGCSAVCTFRTITLLQQAMLLTLCTRCAKSGTWT